MARSGSSKSQSPSHGGDEDIISGLPDTILSHILSFLTTKYAVLTSTLSTKWRYIWTSIPTLDFDDSLQFNSQEFTPQVSFVNFVDRVLNHRDTDICIQRFHLNCRFQNNFSHIGWWIRDVIACGVRDLNLTYDDSPDHTNYIHLPRCLFTCKTLEVLKLNMDFRLQFNYAVLLPSLRVLHLVSLPLTNDFSIKKLIRGCPVLEELVINKDEDESLINLEICSNSLKSLTIRVIKILIDPVYEFSLTIDAPILQYLDISYYVSGAFNVGRLPSLVKANIDVAYDLWGERSDDIQKGIVEGLKGISNVEHLTLSSPTLVCISDESHEVKLPICFNLTHLEVKIPLGYWDCLPYVLKCAPEVTHLIVEEDDKNCCKVFWRMPDCRVKCLLRLEIIEIKGFKGFCEHEMQFAKYFLENSMVLKKMIICSRTIGLEKQLYALKRLTRFPRGSRICELMFS